MKIGTRAILFGVHCFLIHPIVVAIGWRRVHGRWPKDRAEWLAIIFHDFGYLGMPNMDGPEGRRHPLVSASMVFPMLGDDLKQQNKALKLILGHSRYYCDQTGAKLSALFVPDKICVLYEPRWFYLLRGLLSGEVKEFIANGPREFWHGPFRSWRWLNWYRAKVRKHFLRGESEWDFWCNE